ncbi:MAG: cytochrome c3 family protein [Nitrospinota bacterium]
MRFPSRKHIALGSAGIVVVLGLLLWARPAPPTLQPISFNHKVHPLGCPFCHRSVQRLSSAGRPALATCAPCHQALKPRTEAMRKLKDHVDRNEEVPWIRIYRVPAHVYFSHRRHVAAGGLGCETCHGNVSKFTKPVSRPVVEPTMNNCIACHTRKKVSTDCNACHR